MESKQQVVTAPGALADLWAWLKQSLNKLDGALACSAIVLIALLLYDPPQVGKSIVFAGETLLSLWSFLLVAFVLGAYLRASSVDLLLTSVFQGRTTMMIIAAAAFGALSPLCSCGVIPLVAVLLRSGMPLSAVMSFWISSPIISPGMYVLTASVLGYEFATAKLLSAIFMGLASGFLTLWAEKAGRMQSPMRDGSLVRRVSMGAAIQPAWRFWREPERVQTFKQEFITVSVFLLKWMLFAFLLESVLVRYLPSATVAHWVGTDSEWWGILLATTIGIPAYVNGVAAVPLVHGLMAKGMSAGAAMGFLLGGSVTSVPAMSAVFVLVKRSVFLWYVLMGFVTSLVAAALFQLYLMW
jgi:uncharacterized membrane protein YraQ (UPF0718 family)